MLKLIMLTQTLYMLMRVLQQFNLPIAIISAYTSGQATIWVSPDRGGTAKTWTFNNDGILTVPGNINFTSNQTAIGPISRSDAIDVFANTGRQWARLNYGIPILSTLMVWVLIFTMEWELQVLLM
jgi:hypothetical protein